MTAFHTAVSVVRPGRVLVRGYPHEDLIGRVPYAEATFLTLVGRLPSAAEARMVDAMLTSLLDHGFVAATITAARYIASGNPQFVPAVAGGLLAAGSNTLSPEDSCAVIARTRALRDARGISDQEAAAAVVAEFRDGRRRMPGFGHPVHRASDFRADALFALADELGVSADATRVFRTLHEEFVRQSGRTDIPINIDGCLACLGLDLGLETKQIVAIALLAVLPGLMAHVIEEIDDGVPLRYIEDGEYVGEPERRLPDREGGG